MCGDVMGSRQDGGGHVGGIRIIQGRVEGFGQ